MAAKQHATTNEKRASYRVMKRRVDALIRISGNEDERLRQEAGLERWDTKPQRWGHWLSKDTVLSEIGEYATTQERKEAIAAATTLNRLRDRKVKRLNKHILACNKRTNARNAVIADLNKRLSAHREALEITVVTPREAMELRLMAESDIDAAIIKLGKLGYDAKRIKRQMPNI